jgi:hypothetical protein
LDFFKYGGGNELGIKGSKKVRRGAVIEYMRILEDVPNASCTKNVRRGAVIN